MCAGDEEGCGWGRRRRERRGGEEGERGFFDTEDYVCWGEGLVWGCACLEGEFVSVGKMLGWLWGD